MEFERLDVEFESSGVTCAAWLYLPKGVEKPPMVVMAHGFGATRRLMLDKYAERFVARGLAALVFDYRHFGDSGGEPRQLLSVGRQLADWRAAVTYARGLETVDGSRMGLWGSSFSGGHVIVTAAKDQNVKAVVSQVPFVDAIATLNLLGFGFSLKATWRGFRDFCRMLTGRRPYYVPVVAEPDTFAAINTPGSYEGFQSLVPPEYDWDNRVAARILVAITGYRPIAHASRVNCPLLLVPARDDNLIPFKAVENFLGKCSTARLMPVDGGHFAVYQPEMFDEVAGAEADFLVEHL